MSNLFLLAFTLLAAITTWAIDKANFREPLATALFLFGIAGDFGVVSAVEHLCFRPTA
jgi:hypothetical protein